MQGQIRDSAVRALREHAGDAARMASLARGADYDGALWQVISGDLGWLSLAVSEDDDGLGLGAVEIAIVLEQAGQVLVHAPLFETLAAIDLIRLAGTAAQRAAFLPGLMSGALRGSFALSASADDQDAPAAVLRQRPGGDWQLQGVARHVPQGGCADVLVLAASVDGRQDNRTVKLVVVRCDAPGVRVETPAAFDPTRALSVVHFDCIVSDATVLAGGDDVLALVRPGLWAYLAAEQSGLAAGALEMTTAYVKTRQQFGRAVGSFQAVKHTLADMMLAVEAARSASLLAATAIAAGAPDAAEAASVALSTCSDAALFCTGEAIQLHGGIGFTWDYPAHLYFKRARVSATLLGTPEWHRERIACGLGLDGKNAT